MFNRLNFPSLICLPHLAINSLSSHWKGEVFVHSSAAPLVAEHLMDPFKHKGPSHPLLSPSGLFSTLSGLIPVCHPHSISAGPFLVPSFFEALLGSFNVLSLVLAFYLACLALVWFLHIGLTPTLLTASAV